MFDGILVAVQGVAGLRVRLIQQAQVDPRSRVILLQLYSADVSLQSVHRLALLLV